MRRLPLVVAILTVFFSVSDLEGSQTGFRQLAVLRPSNSGAQDNFGYWVSTSGNIAVASGKGGECVFVRPSRGWRSTTEFATLSASSGTELQNVSTNGNTIIASGRDGAAYVFVQPSSGWANMTETAVLTASDGSPFSAVAIDGSVIVAGSPAAIIGASQQGAAFVFVEPSAGWSDMTQTAELSASDGAINDAFGNAVSISGATIAVGSPYNSGGGEFEQGATYVFSEPVGGWANATETAKLIASDGTFDASLGYSVAISGGTIVAGAPSQSDPNGSFGGAAYVFVEPAGGWISATETAQLSPTNGILDGSMGYSVSLSGNLVVAGSPGTLNTLKHQAAYEFLEPAGGWKSMTQTTLEGPSKAPAYAEFGHAVSNSGSTVFVAAPGSIYTNYQGLVYVFGP